MGLDEAIDLLTKNKYLSYVSENRPDKELRIVRYKVLQGAGRGMIEIHYRGGKAFMIDADAGMMEKIPGLTDISRDLSGDNGKIRDQLLHEMFVQGNVMAFLATALGSTSGDDVSNEKPVMRAIPKYDREVVDRFIKYLEENPDDNSNIRELAQRFAMSAGKLQSLFHYYTGITVKDYRDRVRIEKAIRLLRETDLPLFAIAKEVGFRNSSSFSVFFKNNTGKTPGEIRTAAAYH
ncbi:MAG: AraC family transcriptional regulator [Lachnospiraceae bacterium]|nr:AraC family transcriptional regulator [Lachnospiraceae bacterium]